MKALTLALLCLWSIAQARSADITGRVLDADGRPVPGATVYCASNPFVLMVGTPVEKVAHVVTDASGNFRFAPNTVDPQGPGVLVAFHPAKGISKMQTVKREPRNLHLIPLKPFTGKVTDAEGKAVAGAQVRLLFASGQVEGEGVLPPAVEPFVVITDSEGAFTLPVPEGMPSLMVSCRATGYAPQEHFVNPGKDGRLSADALQIKLSPSAKLKARFVQARTGAPCWRLAGAGHPQCRWLWASGYPAPPHQPAHPNTTARPTTSARSAARDPLIRSLRSTSARPAVNITSTTRLFGRSVFYVSTFSRTP